MPVIDLGSVIGPQGTQGATGATGATGAAGAAGPNVVSTSTTTGINGIIGGNGSKIIQVASDSVPTENSNNLVRSGAVYTALQQKTNPNILDNWYFVGGGSQLGGQQFPLNHRGQTQYVGSLQSLDRWYNNGAGTTLTVVSDRITVAGSTEASGYLAQIIDWQLLKGKTVTYSLLYNDSGTLALASGTGVVPSSAPASGNTTTIISLNNQVTNGAGCGLYLNSSGALRVQFGAYNNYTVGYVAAKLEIGNVQTLAVKVNGARTTSEVPDYTEQLERCFTSFVDSTDANAGFYPVGGKINISGNPYIRFLAGSSAYQFNIAANGNLLVEKNTSGTWITVAEYAHI